MEVLTTNSQVDQFRIVRKLGQGGMSEVYLARDVKLGRKVALKIIRAELADSPQRLKLFLREARLTAKFAHPHIVTIYTVGEFEGHLYLALEYLEGQTLAQRMREGAMSVRETMRIGLAIVQALEEAHSHGVLHHDLKPANVIIPKDGRLRVLDFGIAKILEDSIHPPAPDQALNVKVKSEETAFGEIKGTPNYMAPERWLGENVTGATDLWALGVILYKMLTQLHPYHGEDRSIEAIAQRIVSTLNPPILPSEMDVPPELAQLITSLLDRQVSRRPTATDVVQVLQNLLQRKQTQQIERTSPFRGLLPFSERQAELFFGRSAEIEMAVERLRHEPILPVVGPSGAGKSSFVAAGVVPRLRELNQLLLLTVRPGTDPFGALASIIQAGWRGDVKNTTWPSNTVRQLLEPTVETKRNLIAQATSGEAALETPELLKKPALPQKYKGDAKHTSEHLAQKLFEKPATLLLELQSLADETRSTVLLFVDQLEELYTLDHAPELRRAYMEAISRAADDPKGPIRVVFTLRDDFLGRVTDTPSSREVLSRIAVLRAPEEEALLEIVTKPVELAGYSYEDDVMPEEMLDAVRDAPSSLPLLQFACSQLWNRRDRKNLMLTRSAYEAMGGVEGALASEADELLAGLSEVQRNVVRQLVLRLVTPDGTRRVVTEQELLDGLNSSAELVLNRLTASRMVVVRRAVGKGSTEAEFELVHDSLIRNWSPLVRWLEQSREEVVFLDEVSRAAELWDSRGRPSEEVWSDRALDEALTKLERCEVIPHRVAEFLQAGKLRRQARSRRRRTIRFAIVGTLLAIIAVLAFVIKEVDFQRGRAITLMEEAQEQRDRERLARATALREGARAAFTKGDFLEARSKLRGSLEARDSTQARALWWLLENEPLVWSKNLGGFANYVSASPNGRLIAASSGQGFIYIYDTQTLEQRVLRGHKGQVMGISFSPNGRWLASGAHDHDVRLWDLREGTVQVLKGHTDTVVNVDFSPDSARLASGSIDNTIQIWDTHSGTPIKVLKRKNSVHGLQFSKDSRFILAVHREGGVSIWNAQNYELDRVIEEPGQQIFDANFSADGKCLVYSTDNGFIVLYNIEKRQEVRRISCNTHGIWSSNFNSDSSLFASAGRDGIVTVWDTKNWSLRSQYPHTTFSLSSVEFPPSNEHIVSSGFDGTIKLWKMGVQPLKKESFGHDGMIYNLAFAPEGKVITTCGVDGDLLFWDVTNGQSFHRIQGHDSAIVTIDYNKSGTLLASAAYDGNIRIWTIPEGKLLKTLLGHKTWISRVVFSPDGKQLVSASHDTTIGFWDMESLTQHKSLATGNVVNYVDFDPEGRLLALTTRRTIEVRNAETGEVLQTYAGHSADIRSVVFSPDGQWLYSSSDDTTVRRHQVSSSSREGEEVARHDGAILWLDVAPIGKIIGTPSADRTAKIWNLETNEFLTLRGHQSDVNALKFSSDGTRAATVSDDGTLRLWDTKTGWPLWRAPLMLEGPPLLLTPQGWIGFDPEAEPEPSTKQWQKSLETQGRIASATPDRETLCLVTFNNELEIWDIPNDRRSWKTQDSGIQQILALRKGCLTRSNATLTLTKASGESVPLGKQVDAMSRFEDSVFFLQDGKIHVLDPDGNKQEEFEGIAGALALTLIGNTIVLGFPEGSIEIWKRNERNSQKILTCREVFASPVTTIIPGPPNTIIAGYANGYIGIWSLETGERLYSQRLHGPVVHLLHNQQKLLAATELGSRLQLDLTMFHIDYCELMERIWNSVPWIWTEGRARFRERPSDHTCSNRR